jgi:hypothetical protein
MKNRTDSDLLVAVEEFTTPLRDGSGFDEDAFQHLCRLLEDLAHQWAQLDAIPKAAAIVLVDLWPGIQNCSYLYGGDESNRIMKAADVIADLTRNIVEE